MDNLLDKIKSFFNVDITEKGRSNKLAVVLRAMGCLVISCCLFGAFYFLSTGQMLMVGYDVVLILVYLILFRLCHDSGPNLKIIAVSAVDLISVFVGFKIVGPRGIFQIYLFILIVLCYFSDYGYYLRKAVYSFVICLVYIGLTILSGCLEPLIFMNNIDYIVLQIINIVCSSGCLVIMCTVFSKDSQQLEGKLTEYNKMLEKQATTDPLTGLCNRRKAIEFIGNLIVNNNEKGFCVCMCDIDFFKKVNDSYGHDIGDNVLRKMAETMIEGFPKNCLISRWGGEEFLVIFPNMNGDDAKMILDVMRTKIKKLEFAAGDKKFNITVTYGLAEYGFSETGEELVKEADNKLYMGKENGRDQVVY